MWPNESILSATYQETDEQRRAREIRNAEIWLAECKNRLKGARLALKVAKAG